jgi:hypothetical protein
LIRTEYGTLRDISIQIESLLHQLGNGIYIIHLFDGGYTEHFRIVRY